MEYVHVYMQCNHTQMSPSMHGMMARCWMAEGFSNLGGERGRGETGGGKRGGGEGEEEDDITPYFLNHTLGQVVVGITSGNFSIIHKR